MNKKYNKCVSKVLELAEEEMFNLNHPYVGTEHLLLSLLKCDNTKKILNKYDLTYKIFKDKLLDIVGMSNIKSKYILYTPLLKEVIDKSIKEPSCDEITLLKYLLSSDDGIAIRILTILNIDLDSLYIELNNTYSYLEEIGKNMLNNIDDNYLIGRDKEINNIIEILLRKNKNNPILIGEAGVGKTAIVYELAKRIKNKEVPDQLKDKIIYMLDMSTLLSNTKYRGEFETKINNIIKEIELKDNIILFIDEIHTLVKTGGGEGSLDAANILKPYLSSNKLKLIGATTINEYEKYISIDQALNRRFAKIYIKEPTEEETINILTGVKPIYEKYHNTNIDNNIITKIVNLSTKYITNNQNPDKSLEILDCLLSRVNLNMYNNSKDYYNSLTNHDFKTSLLFKINKNKITEEDIIKVIEDLNNIKILNLNDYNNLCNILDKKYKDIDKLKLSIKDKFLNNKIISINIRDYNIAKFICNYLNYNLIELDMKEYSSIISINRLIGVEQGYIGYQDKCILDEIKEKPYSMIILKNINYAHPNIINLFESIVDKGYFIDNKNNKINFNLSLIVKINSNKINKIGYKNDLHINYNEVYMNS